MTTGSSCVLRARVSREHFFKAVLYHLRLFPSFHPTSKMSPGVGVGVCDTDVPLMAGCSTASTSIQSDLLCGSLEQALYPGKSHSPDEG